MSILNSVFTSHMVLQANKPIRIFGEGKGNVTVSFIGKEKTVSANGTWLLEFDPMSYGGPYEILVDHEGEITQLNDVWIGDVFFLGGQSNMALHLHETNFPMERYEGNEHVRLYTVDRTEPDSICSADGWVTLTKENAKDFSAIGYHVAQALASKDRKVGLISCCQGASVIQAWMSRELAASPCYQVENKAAGHTKYPFNAEGFLFEYMTSKILPFSLHTVLWYQGESNASVEEANIYLSMLEGLVGLWRREFRDPTLPFLVVQIADYVDRDGEAWRTIQNAQLKAPEVIPYIKTVISRDVCETDDIHPPTKHILAERIVRALQ